MVLTDLEVNFLSLTLYSHLRPSTFDDPTLVQQRICSIARTYDRLPYSVKERNG